MTLETDTGRQPRPTKGELRGVEEGGDGEGWRRWTHKQHEANHRIRLALPHPHLLLQPIALFLKLKRLLVQRLCLADEKVDLLPAVENLLNVSNHHVFDFVDFSLDSLQPPGIHSVGILETPKESVLRKKSFFYDKNVKNDALPEPLPSYRSDDISP